MLFFRLLTFSFLFVPSLSLKVDHHDALLLALWSGMRPNVRLQAMSSSSSSIASASTASTATTETSSSSSSSPSLASVEAWGELGFQNSDDPCSDFRGGGLWALVQVLGLGGLK